MTYPHKIEGANGNGNLWDRVSTSVTGSTKRVSLGSRSFTAIDAYAQIKAATAEFGPVGMGWGWTVEGMTIEAGAIIIELQMWWGTGPEKHRFTALGCEGLLKKSGQVDTDAPKKALTDAITKGLSYLGFNADVFFGAFDDNKYVADLQRAEQASTRMTLKEVDVQATDDHSRVGKPVASDPPAKKAAAPGSPPWASELIGGKGRFADKPWAYLLGGGADGGRHKWMRAAYPKYSDQRIRTRLAWILEKYYGDNEAVSGALDTQPADDSSS